MAMPVSGELPTVRKIRLDGPARRTASSMSAVLPMPAGPRTRMAVPASRSARRAAIRACSASRPTSWPPRARRFAPVMTMEYPTRRHKRPTSPVSWPPCWVWIAPVPVRARVASWLAVLQDRQDVTRRIGEPGDERAAAPVDALGVLLHPRVALEAHASAGQLIDGRVDVVDLEVEDGEAGRGVIGLRIDQCVSAAGQPQREQAVLFGYPQAERLGVELPGLIDIADGEPAECLGVREHNMLLPRDCTFLPAAATRSGTGVVRAGDAAVEVCFGRAAGNPGADS